MHTKNISKYIIFILLILFTSSTLYAKSVTTQESERNTLKKYTEKIDTINNQVYSIGQYTSSSSITAKDKLDLIKRIELEKNNIKNLSEEITSYTSTFGSSDINVRNGTILTIVLNYYKNALVELSVYINSDDPFAKFNALERFFYAKITATQSLDWVKRLLDQPTEL